MYHLCTYYGYDIMLLISLIELAIPLPLLTSQPRMCIMPRATELPWQLARFSPRSPVCWELRLVVCLFYLRCNALR